MNNDTSSNNIDDDQLHQAVRQELVNGTSIHEIAKELEKEGVSSEEAYKYVRLIQKEVNNFLYTPEGVEFRKNKYKSQMKHSLIITCIGILITILSFFLAFFGYNEGYYHITWGIIAFGAIKFFIEYYKWSKLKKLSEKSK
ncbi:hypothetical protein KKG24_01845 [Patescibacteria group bacterium]|nr:hypothetical protein [Patescibacteria group bacterium]